jgi:hypothetical protein
MSCYWAPSRRVSRPTILPRRGRERARQTVTGDPLKEILGRDLRAAFSSIRATRPREGEARHWSYAGIRLRPPSGEENIGGLPGPAMFLPLDKADSRYQNTEAPIGDTD